MSTVTTAKLTQFQRRVLDFIRSKAHLAQGVCQATRTLAARFGVCVSYVQKTLKRLRDLGLVEREFDYGLRSRRRFYPAGAAPEGPGPSPPEPLFLDGLRSVHSTDSGPSIFGPPLDPPVEESGDDSNARGGGECAATAEGSPLPPEPVEEPVEEKEAASAVPKATPEQVKALVAKSREVVPGRPAAWVLRLARRLGYRPVAQALVRGEAALRGGRTVTDGYVVRAAEGIAADGGVESDPLAPAAAPSPGGGRAARIARFAERLRAQEEETARIEAECREGTYSCAR